MRKDRGASGPGRRAAGRRWRSMSMGAAVIVAGALVPVTDTAALWDDQLELFVSEVVAHDSNVFRISSRVDPVVVLGSSSKGDTYSTTSPGFNLNVPVSRQRFVGGVKWNYTRYNRFTVLDFDGHEGRAVWQWQAGNDLGGQLGYTETLALASLANSRAGVLTGTPNSLETQRAFFSAAYLLTPRWRLRGEASRLRQENGLSALRVNDIIIDAGDFGVNYVTPLKNQVGLGVRVEEGRFPNREVLAGSPSDNPYRQLNVDAVTEWTVTGHSRLSARAGWVSRRHDQMPQRDFEDATFHAAYDWQPTGKLTLNMIARREISPLDDTYSTFVLLTGIALNPMLRLTDKTSLAATLEYYEREYLSDPGVLLAQPRTDQVRTAGLKATYRPLRSVMLEMAVMRQTRSSTFPLGDYEVTVASLGARIGF